MLLLLIFSLVSAELNFTYIPPYRTPPSMRSGHIMSLSTSMNSLILFGGTYTPLLYNDLWFYSLTTLSWTESTPTTSERPSNLHIGERSYLGGFVSVFNGNFYIFGGSSALGPQNDFWEFDLKNFKWTKISIKNSPLIRSGFAYTNFVRNGAEYFVVYGGILISSTDDNLML